MLSLFVRWKVAFNGKLRIIDCIDYMSRIWPPNFSKLAVNWKNNGGHHNLLTWCHLFVDCTIFYRQIYNASVNFESTVWFHITIQRLTQCQSPDQQILDKNILKYPNNPRLGFVNINSLKNRIIDIWEVTGKLSLD